MLFDTTDASARVASRQKRGAGGEVVETARDVMVRRLTANRVDALRELIKETQEKHRCAPLTFNGHRRRE